MATLGLETTIQSREIFNQTRKRLREHGIKLPKFKELCSPSTIDETILSELEKVSPNAPDPRNLFRIHWYNRPEGGTSNCPHYIALPKALTGVDATILVMVGANFPMIQAHKVLAAYGCLAPRLVTGQFDPTQHRAIWPSTGNYCRGGIAVSRIMDCHGVAILPEEMSQERFDWLKTWCLSEKDIVATPGCESNVKEIYDACNELDKIPSNIIFNQFSEFGNALVHYACTGKALQDIFEDFSATHPGANPAAFVSATGSAGTLSAGDFLKEQFGTKIVAVEAVECPTLLYNGFGGHNIQGIGDKHIPLVHNAMNTDVVVGISDKNTDHLFTLFNTDQGRDYLAERRKLSDSDIDNLKWFGLSSICNILAAIKYAKHFQLTDKDTVLTVATDSAEMYQSEKQKVLGKPEFTPFDRTGAAEIFGQYLAGLGTDHLKELSYTDRLGIFNLGYYTWVEQQGISLEAFEARKKPEFWTNLRSYLDEWDALIDEFNAKP